MRMLKTLFYFMVGVIVIMAFIFSIVGIVKWGNQTIEKTFGSAFKSSLEYSTATPSFLSTYLTAGFTSTTTVSFSGGDNLRINLWGKPGTATSSMGVYIQASDDGTNFFTIATGTQDGIYKAYTYPTYTFLPGTNAVTSTISFSVPLAVIENAKYIRASFNETDLSTDPDDGVNVYIELWKKTQ